MVRFNPLDESTFVSQKLNNGDFDYWLVLQVTDWRDNGDETGAWRYNVSLSAVSPTEAGKTNVERALNGYGVPPDDHRDPTIEVECLYRYGIYAPLWGLDGNNLRVLMREARKQAQCCEGLFGFYMDTPKNRVGATGWDCIRGRLVPQAEA